MIQPKKEIVTKYKYTDDDIRRMQDYQDRKLVYQELDEIEEIDY